MARGTPWLSTGTTSSEQCEHSGQVGVAGYPVVAGGVVDQHRFAGAFGVAQCGQREQAQLGGLGQAQRFAPGVGGQYPPPRILNKSMVRDTELGRYRKPSPQRC
jgi:hypothetical protein